MQETSHLGLHCDSFGEDNFLWDLEIYGLLSLTRKLLTQNKGKQCHAMLKTTRLQQRCKQIVDKWLSAGWACLKVNWRYRSPVPALTWRPPQSTLQWQSNPTQTDLSGLREVTFFYYMAQFGTVLFSVFGVFLYCPRSSIFFSFFFKN